MTERKPEDWRKLCAAAANEPDSEKLFSLVSQILEAFDDRRKDPRASSPAEDCGQGGSGITQTRKKAVLNSLDELSETCNS